MDTAAHWRDCPHAGPVLHPTQCLLLQSMRARAAITAPSVYATAVILP